MALPSGKRIGLDVGAVRNGLAISDLLGMLATPLGSCPPDQLISKIHEICEQEEIAAIYVGLPLHLSGETGAAAQQAREIAELIAREKLAPVYLVDERLTTKSASMDPFEVKRFGIDAVAAREILRFALDGERSTGELFGEKVNV